MSDQTYPEPLGRVFPGADPGTFLAISFRLKAYESAEAFTDLDRAKEWVQSFALGDAFTDFDWVDVMRGDGTLSVALLAGRRMTDAEIDEAIAELRS